ncbi:MAG: hypothetical protein ABR520_06970 [Mycobacteriales bacterium]|nr:hypothetical protein [Frankia sp.]
MTEVPDDATPDYVESVPASPSLNDATEGEPPTDGFTVVEGTPGPSGSQPEVAEYPDASEPGDAADVVDGLLPEARDDDAGSHAPESPTYTADAQES